jgi:hypothetical protein
MTRDYLPELFEISYKHEFNGTKSIKLMNNILMVNDPNPEMIDICSIDEEKWTRFWENIEKAGRGQASSYDNIENISFTH